MNPKTYKTLEYTKIIEKMLEGVDVYLGVDFINDKNYYMSKAKKIIYTGAVDEFFNYKYGELAYRSLRFEENILDIDSYQGAAVINYCEESIPYTRVIEHKFFCENLCLHKTVVTKEFPISWQRGAEPYYPVNDEYNNKLYLRNPWISFFLYKFYKFVIIIIGKRYKYER